LSEESRRKNEFLATLAHELRNPLSPIKNAVQLMEMMNLDGDVNELRNTMARQVEQLVRLIDDLMDISRVGRGKLELRKEFSRMDAIVHAAVEASMPLIESNRQRIEVQIDETEMVVEADPARITQVICNLLNNAAKYSHADCKILLTVKRVEENIEIRVKDNGAGIAPDQLETIFDMYSQLGDSVERGTAGLGIGLALVRTLVELHGGTVTAHSDGEGRGSEFLVRIPATSQAAEIKTSNTPSVSDIPQRAYRVLVVEDMRALALVLARLLTKLGHHVEIVESGEAAIDKLRTLDAEVIFSDISMPMMTGYELARFLRSNEATSKIKLVAMTGYGQLSDREKAFAAGFDEHMTKPVDVQRLREFFQGLEAV
jgi:CheY-like chemotaxis protein